MQSSLTDELVKNTEAIGKDYYPIVIADVPMLVKKLPKSSCVCHGLGYTGIRWAQTIYTDKLGPNASCPCKSGKKYKKCCRDKTDKFRNETMHKEPGNKHILICKCVEHAIRPNFIEETFNGKSEETQEA